MFVHVFKELRRKQVGAARGARAEAGAHPLSQVLLMTPSPLLLLLVVVVWWRSRMLVAVLAAAARARQLQMAGGRLRSLPPGFPRPTGPS